MQFAILLLAVLAIACSAGSFITQGQTYDWYAKQYSERAAALILALHLDDAFHSWWFVLINVFLCINLLLCNVLRFPRLKKRMETEMDAEKWLQSTSGETAQKINRPEEVFLRLRMPKPKQIRTADGREILFSFKNRIGLWGAWICHFGILLLILGFGLGQMTRKQYTVYGVPGQTKPIGDTGLVLTIDDFQVDLREDDTVRQYTADITVRDMTEKTDGEIHSEQAQISVHNPAFLFGMKFYQNSTGWAAQVSVTEAGEPLQEETLCVGEYLAVQDKPELVILLNAFYPDYLLDPVGGPMTVSGQLNNPAYLYTVYYQNQILGMNALMESEELTIDDYVVKFSRPQSYTLIQIKKDSFTWLAFVGGMVIMIGLFLAFYLLPVRVCAVREADDTWTVRGICKKGGTIFREQFARAVKGEEENGGER